MSKNVSIFSLLSCIVRIVVKKLYVRVILLLMFSLRIPAVASLGSVLGIYQAVSFLAGIVGFFSSFVVILTSFIRNFWSLTVTIV